MFLNHCFKSSFSCSPRPPLPRPFHSCPRPCSSICSPHMGVAGQAHLGISPLYDRFGTCPRWSMNHRFLHQAESQLHVLPSDLGFLMAPLAHSPSFLCLCRSPARVLLRAGTTSWLSAPPCRSPQRQAQSRGSVSQCRRGCASGTWCFLLEPLIQCTAPGSHAGRV